MFANWWFIKERPILGLTGAVGSGGAGGHTAGGAGVPGITGSSGGTLVSPNPGGMELRHFPGPGNFNYTSSDGDNVIHVMAVGGGGSGGFGGGGAGGVV